MPGLPPGFLSYFGHWLHTQIFWQGGKIGFRRLRKAHPDVFDIYLRWPFTADGSRLTTPLLLACSPTIIPCPDDWSASHIHIPGYFFLDTPNTFQPPAALVDFLSNSEPPICVTFGSMIHCHADRIYRTILDAISQTENRGVILTGWGGLRELALPGNIFVTESVPHDWLFSQCKAVIHHGGAGTTAAGLRVGVPNIVVPFAADQPFWGARVRAIGAGPKATHVKKLTAEKLITALTEAGGKNIRNGAQATGRMIRAEDGVGQTVELIEEFAAEWRESPQSAIF